MPAEPSPGARELMPNFFLVGAMKAGTTSLANLLARHPDVYLPPIKEPNFFATDVNATTDPRGRHHSFDAITVEAALDPVKPRRAQVAIVRDRTEYQALYAAGAGRARRGDCSTAYLFSRRAAEEIAACCPDARILVMVRDPVTRAISEYRMRRAIGSARGPLAAEIEEELAAIARNAPVHHGARLYLRAGFYAEQIERFRRAFGPENVMILVFERFIRDQQGHVDAVCDFLGIARRPLAGEERANAGHVPRSARLSRLLHAAGGMYFLTRIGPHLPAALKRRLVRLWFRDDRTSYDAERPRLRALFAAEVERMEALLGTPLPEWGPPPCRLRGPR
jgi:hypothetical protein